MGLSISLKVVSKGGLFLLLCPDSCCSWVAGHGGGSEGVTGHSAVTGTETHPPVATLPQWRTCSVKEVNPVKSSARSERNVACSYL